MERKAGRYNGFKAFRQLHSKTGPPGKVRAEGEGMSVHVNISRLSRMAERLLASKTMATPLSRHGYREDSEWDFLEGGMTGEPPLDPRSLASPYDVECPLVDASDDARWIHSNEAAFREQSFRTYYDGPYSSVKDTTLRFGLALLASCRPIRAAGLVPSKTAQWRRRTISQKPFRSSAPRPEQASGPTVERMTPPPEADSLDHPTDEET